MAGGVVPAQAAAHLMVAAVEAVAAERGDVDAADERDLVVDDHELLVVAVHRALVGVERAVHARSAHEPLARIAHGRAVGREQRQRRAAPQQHPDVDSLGQIAEQIAQPSGPGVARQAELGRDVPAGDVHVRAGAVERLGDARQRLRAVDQHLQRVAFARRRIAGSPQRFALGGLELIESTRPLEPQSVMCADGPLDRLPSPSVDPLDRCDPHRCVPVCMSMSIVAPARAARRCRSLVRASGRPAGPRCGSPRACPSRARRACSARPPRRAARRSSATRRAAA